MEESHIDIDRLLETVKRLEARADEIPWWKKGTIVFAEPEGGWEPPTPEVAQDTGEICYSLQGDDWIRTERKTEPAKHPKYGLFPFSQDFYYRCKICGAEFLWRNGKGHKAGEKV